MAARRTGSRAATTAASSSTDSAATSAITSAYGGSTGVIAYRIHTSGFSLPNAGRGIIIADSHFTISGSNMWDGIILVGGKLTSNGNNTTFGTTMSGLNLLLPNAQPLGQGTIIDDATANGNKDYVYNSCYVSRATQPLRRFMAIADTWIDDVPAW